ncbi:hypothetical protein M8J77_015678 [Diaphorina citri]|nr:hypothetical protein M8J77_015678 [Diaphorina citri]
MHFLRPVSKNVLLDLKYLMPQSCFYSSQPLLLVTEQNGVRDIIMNDQKTRNSLSLSMMKELITAINNDKDNPTLRCITLRSSHSQVFSSGHNLKQMAVDKEGRPKLDEIFSTCSDLMLSILRHPVPILAIISGVAAAAGCQLVATCDLAIATTASKFSTPGARHGIFCSTPAVALTRKVPLGVVRSMTITGIPISAQDAYNAGLITRVVSSNEELESETKVLTGAILENSRSVLTLGKQFLYQQMSLNIEEAYRLGGNTMVHNLCLKDGVEGMHAFSEKRQPVWSHTDDMFPGVK